MSDQKFTIEHGESIEVIVSRKTGGRDVSVREKKKGIISAHRKLDYLARRKKKSGGIQIYDLSRRIDDSLITFLDFYREIDDSLPYDAYQTPDAAFYDDLQSFIFSSVSDVTLLPTICPPIKKAENNDYQIEIYGVGVLYSYDDPADDGKFTSGGIKIDSPELIKSIFISNGESLLIADSKVTATFDIDAAEISFEFAGKDQVFIMPRAHIVTASADDLLYDGGSRLSNTNYLNYIFAIAKAPFVAGLPFIPFEYFIASTDDPPSSDQTGQYKKVWEHINYVKTGFAVRAAEKLLVGGTYSAISVSDFGQPIFPNDSPTPFLNRTTDEEEGKFLQSRTAAIFSAPPRLSAIIKRDTLIFYVWRT